MIRSLRKTQNTQKIKENEMRTKKQKIKTAKKVKMEPKKKLKTSPAKTIVKPRAKLSAKRTTFKVKKQSTINKPSKQRNDIHLYGTPYDINKPSSLNNISKDVAPYNGRGNLDLVLPDGRWGQIRPQWDGTYLVRSPHGEKYLKSVESAKKELVKKYTKEDAK